MKWISLFLICFVSLNSHASGFRCKAGPKNFWLISGGFAAECSSKKDRVELSVVNIGVGFHLDLEPSVPNDMVLICSGAKDPRGTYAGVRVECSIALGGCAAIFIGEKGLCTMGGMNFGLIGFDIGLAELTIE
ncbi:MAG: hypothetical protein IT289_12725 [Oligoflexia bacterium]|nr:hypothetical protein [Oligoflexia bacterium]